MRGWEIPATIRAAMMEPIGPDTPLAVLGALRDDVANRAGVFPDAELARQALDLCIALREGADPGPSRTAAPAAARVVDDRDDCEEFPFLICGRIFIDRFVPGGLLPTDHMIVAADDGGCSRCRSDIGEHEAPFELWSEDGRVLWIYCRRCMGWHEGAE